MLHGCVTDPFSKTKQKKQKKKTNKQTKNGTLAKTFYDLIF